MFGENVVESPLNPMFTITKPCDGGTERGTSIPACTQHNAHASHISCANVCYFSHVQKVARCLRTNQLNRLLNQQNRFFEPVERIPEQSPNTIADSRTTTLSKK
jgi:hypothetical protein